MSADPSPLLTPVPEALEGPRLRLRPYRPEDAPALWDAVEESREALQHWLRWPAGVRSPDDARERVVRLQAQWLLRERLAWAITDRRSGSLLGDIALVHLLWPGRVFEVGYWLRRSSEGRGYMSEALALLTRALFETLGANRVVVRVEAGNARSRKVPEALGYVLEGTLRREHPGLDGRPADMCVYALILEDYRALLWVASGGASPSGAPCRAPGAGGG